MIGGDFGFWLLVARGGACSVEFGKNLANWFPMWRSTFRQNFRMIRVVYGI